MKYKILEMLEAERGECVSGAVMAAALGVSREAVSKAVNSLKNQGYQIEASAGKGYRLSADCDKLSAVGIRKYLKADTECDIFIYEETTSTNTIAKQEMRSGKQCVLVTAERQTQGRGRLGKDFYSPPSSGVYLTVGLRPKESAEKTVFLTVAAAVAAARAIDRLYGIQTQIKWVNDIYYQGKKLCGILTEAEFEVESGGIAYAVVGIGVNIRPPEGGFPEELREKAGALSQFSEKKVLRNQLIAELVNQLNSTYAQLESLGFLQEYQRRSCLTGKKVTVLQTGAEPKTAKVLEIDDRARLVVQTDSGEILSLSSGDVSICPE